MWYRIASMRAAIVFDPAGQGIMMEEEIPRRFDTSQIRFDYGEVNQRDYDSDGKIIARAGSRELGYIDFSLDARDEKPFAYIHMVEVDPEYRRWGIGEILYQELVRFIRKNYKWIRGIRGNVHSREALQTRLQVLGQPSSIKGPEDRTQAPGDYNPLVSYTTDEALDYLMSGTESDLPVEHLEITSPFRRKRQKPSKKPLSDEPPKSEPE